MPPKLQPQQIKEMIDQLGEIDIEPTPTPKASEGDMTKIKKRILTPQALEKLALAREKAHEVVRAKGKIARQIKQERSVVASNLARKYVEQQEIEPVEEPVKVEPIKIKESKPLPTNIKRVVKKKVIYYTDEPPTENDFSSIEEPTPLPPKTKRQASTPRQIKQAPPTQHKPMSYVDSIINTFY